MATLIKYESWHDRKNYYECQNCMQTKLESEVDICPNCGAHITDVFDETEITHNQNEAILAQLSDPDNDDLKYEVFNWGIQRCAIETPELFQSLINNFKQVNPHIARKLMGIAAYNCSKYNFHKGDY